jgi:5-amino-6-(5-phosphoribosylamino)uracil reductase
MYSQRAECDAILIGAGTVRKDNPSLLFHRPHLVDQRVRNGLEPELIKVTLTSRGELDPLSKFFTSGEGRKIVMCPPEMQDMVSRRLGSIAEIISVTPLCPNTIVLALERIGIHKLFIEGGTSVLTAFISSGIFHRLRVAIAPFFVGDDAAPRFVGNAKFVHGKHNRLRLVRCRGLGDMTVIDFENEPRLQR